MAFFVALVTATICFAIILWAKRLPSFSSGLQNVPTASSIFFNYGQIFLSKSEHLSIGS
ncbi:MAG: hypothetical protein GXO77_04330 [Calditrichaeota bacterium]|nr:hypothetical protein [Calditrichota bacterium]